MRIKILIKEQFVIRRTVKKIIVELLSFGPGPPHKRFLNPVIPVPTVFGSCVLLCKMHHIAMNISTSRLFWSIFKIL